MPPKSKRVLPGKRYPLNMRTTKELRDKIEEAAMASGRSLVQEVEFRLERSFREDDAYGGPRLSPKLRMVVDSIAALKTGGTWAETDRARADIAKVFVEMLAKEVPGFYSVTIETEGQKGEIRGVTAYATEEFAKRDHPGIAEILRARREAAVPRGEQPATDKREDPK